MAADGEKSLPAGWEEHVDEETGQTYFWNTETGTSSWTNPALQDSSLPFGWEQLEGAYAQGCRCAQQAQLVAATGACRTRQNV